MIALAAPQREGVELRLLTHLDDCLNFSRFRNPVGTDDHRYVGQLLVGMRANNVRLAQKRRPETFQRQLVAGEEHPFIGRQLDRQRFVVGNIGRPG